MSKNLAMHNGTDVRIVAVERETPKFIILLGGYKFKKIGNPTPNKVAVGWGNGTFNSYVLSEVDSDVVKNKISTMKRKNNTRDILASIEKKFPTSSWSNQNNYLTLEQAKHLNEYLDLGLEIEE